MRHYRNYLCNTIIAFFGFHTFPIPSNKNLFKVYFKRLPLCQVLYVSSFILVLNTIILNLYLKNHIFVNFILKRSG